ncbi:hypothetical protein [Actinoplanes palleronii]|uniref:Flavin reductase n=1 Tax=Actinoplanes palleronii TaxID=113570 RepID=A0ABQ4BM60_9ACTN|nr:hypothetical protein [Actinoplanes palleronii]GIE71749.1 hypothetical protein Apa02nite_078570 [Actinoplanes palleronii]
MAQPTAVITQVHTPGRPSWDCVACEQLWPCDPAREAMKAEMAATPLAILMWSMLDEAVRDLPPTPATELFERFVKWTG